LRRIAAGFAFGRVPLANARLGILRVQLLGSLLAGSTRKSFVLLHYSEFPAIPHQSNTAHSPEQDLCCSILSTGLVILFPMIKLLLSSIKATNPMSSRSYATDDISG
jgi:hypothetical protein